MNQNFSKRSALAIAIVLMTGASFGAANAQQTERVSFNCDISGQSGILQAEVTTMERSGIVKRGRDISGVIGTGEIAVYYQGNLKVGTNHYIFSGENQYADFTDTNTYARFLVRMELNGSSLRMTADPFGSPQVFMCQRSN